MGEWARQLGIGARRACTESDDFGTLLVTQKAVQMTRPLEGAASGGDLRKLRNRPGRRVMRSSGLVTFAGVLAVLAAPSVASAQTPSCTDCHAPFSQATGAGKHATLTCASCHTDAAPHLADPGNPSARPRPLFDQETCRSCHRDQYDTFEIVAGGPTAYGGSDGGEHAPKGWSKTWDLPYWNVLIDGHPFVLETYEDRPMAVNQIEHQETIRPGSEACMECHGTRAAFMTGIEYRDKNGVVRSIPATKTTVTLPGGGEPVQVQVPAREYVVRSTPSNRSDGHLIYDGTSHQDLGTGEWKEAVNATLIPKGTKVWTYIDGVNPSGGPNPQRYQVKTLVTLPAPATAQVKDKFGQVLGEVTFTTIASFPEAGADINGSTGTGIEWPGDANVATVARDWIYAAMEALAFDGLDYYFNDPHGETHFTGGGANWPSVVSGELCNQCHDPHSGKLRIVKKPLIAAIAERGINPYSTTGKDVLRFEDASRQDQIVAVCAQCHSEYVGGYSANTRLDQNYFPWAKPADLEKQYQELFGYLQDWTHGGPVVPWQSSDPNARGFFPYGERFPIGEPLVKVQHPEAETFLNSPMYNAGATCTDCHSTRVTRPDGTQYTSHWFASPLKLMEGFVGQTETGQPVLVAGQNPCVRCHTTDTVAQSRQRIVGAQDAFSFVQERTQVALVNALRFIKEQKGLGADVSAHVKTYQRAAMRWEYYTQAENSMGFHNVPEATAEVTNARLWVAQFIPWPLTPVDVRITSAGPTNLTLAFFDQAANETGFRVERAPALTGPWVRVADIPTPTGANVGDVQFTDTGLVPSTAYFYRVAAYGAGGTSVFSIWTRGTTAAGPPPLAAPSGLVATASTERVSLSWTDNSSSEAGFRIERAADAAFTTGLKAFQVGANVAVFVDTGLPASTTYHYRVFAVGPDGSSSAPSNVASATTPASRPAAPANLVVTSTAQTAISIRWEDRSTNETDVRVERRTGTTWTEVGTLPANTTQYTSSGLARRTTYSFRVRAHNAAGFSTYSNVVSAKTR
jgi:formate-dependent nitrite reductase cytochrome c552 subunit/chitodextrinase